MKCRAIILAACISVLGLSSQARAILDEFTPRNGFSGYTAGNGVLRLSLGKPRPFHVESHGYEQADGSFRLDQTVTFKGQPSRQRSWLLKSIHGDRWTGTLSDASGPVTGTTNGSRLVLRYRIKGPVVMHQELELLPDGKTIDNVGKITLMGIPIGHLHETIKRKDDAHM